MTASVTRAGTPRPVVVGATPGQASRAFASELESCTALSYRQFDDERLSEAADFVGVAAGDGMVPIVRTALAAARDRGLTVAVEMPPDPAAGPELKTVLLDGGVPLEDVRRINGRTCLVFSTGAAAPARDETWLLDRIFVAAGPTPASPTDRPEQVADQWLAAAAEARVVELQQQVEEQRLTEQKLRGKLRELRDEAQQARRAARKARGPRKQRRPQRRQPAPPPASLPVRVLYAVSGLLGATTRRQRLVHLVLMAVTGLVGLALVTTVFGLIGGRDGALLGFAFAALLAAVGGVGLVLLARLRRVEGGTHDAAGRVIRATRLQTQRTGRRTRETHRKLRTMQERNRNLNEAVFAFLETAPATGDDVYRSEARLTRQVQGALNLSQLVRVDAAVPAMAGWRATPDLLAELVTLLVRDRPRLVVETGSGVSTLFLALAAEQHQLDVRIVALEHQRQFVADTVGLLERHGVAHRAEVRYAPLARTSVPEHQTPWYDEAALADLRDIDLVLVDGPPATTGPAARYPFVPLMKDRLAARCTIVVDDMVRDEDREVVDRWQELLPDFERDGLDLVKGAARLRRGFA